jgi:phosphatidylserine/phosphatidylglycerophosphate/cardiolipin synthase-like enzyme
MDYVVWVAIGAVATAVGSLVGLIVHVVRYAYAQGRTASRLDVLEKGQDGLASLLQALAALTSQVHALQASIDRLDRIVERIDASGSRAARRKIPMEAA